jgi:hypothetical protein
MVGSSRGGVLAVSVASAREEKLQRRRELSRSSRLCVWLPVSLSLEGQPRLRGGYRPGDRYRPKDNAA